MNVKLTPYGRVSDQLLRGIPRPKPFGRLVDGRFLTGVKSLHKTPQGVKWRRFWRLKQQRHRC